MLVVKRRLFESVIIDHPSGPITVTAVDITPNGVKLGVTAPQAVSIMRQELLTKEKEHEQAR